MANGTEELRDGCTLEEIAREMNVTRERIRQIEVAALRKCRRWCASHGYSFEDLCSVWSVPDWDRTGD